MKCKGDPSFSDLFIEKVKFEVRNDKKNLFTKRNIITFYSRKQKHEIFEKTKIFHQTASLTKHISCDCLCKFNGKK